MRTPANKIKSSWVLLSLYLLAAIVYLAASDTGELWSCFYFVKDNLFIITTALIARSYMQLKIIPNIIIVIKSFSTVSLIARFLFNFTLFYDYAFVFLTILIIPLFLIEWRTITRDI